MKTLALLWHSLGEDDPKDLTNRLKRDTNEKILKDIGGAVDVGLTALKSGVRRQASSLGFSTDEALVDIARDLRFKLADHGVEPEDLRSRAELVPTGYAQGCSPPLYTFRREPKLLTCEFHNPGQPG